MLLAVLCLVWYAGTLAPDNAVISGNYTAVGNSYARFSSENAELLSGDGEVLSAVEFGYPERYLTSSGETAVAWEPGGNIAFLGAGGARLEKAEGRLLGVFGSDTVSYTHLTKGQIFFKVTLLQMIKRIVPPMSNEIITLVKDTSLARIISYQEVIWAGFAFLKGSHGYSGLLWPLFFTGVYYLVFNGVVSFLLVRLEKKLEFFR